MSDKPDPNPNDEKEEVEEKGYAVGGDHIVVQGDVGVGASIGRGYVQADYIAGRDLIIATDEVPKADDKKQFADLMIKLRDLIIKAHQAGELSERTAKKALGHLATTAELVAKEEKPPKNQILSRLQYVADVLDAAVDYLSTSGGAARVVLQALPIATLLIKIASRLF